LNELEELKSKISKLDLESLNSITFLVYEIENDSKNDLFILSKLIDEKSLNRLINHYDGTAIRIPSIDDYKRSSVLALYFYLMDIKNKSFKDATNIIESSGYKIEESISSIGKQVSALRQKLAIRIKEVIEDIQDERE
jgi:hypothetical protein